VRLQLAILPAGDLSNFGVADMRAIGLRITALPLVDAIPAVCAARPASARTPTCRSWRGASRDRADAATRRSCSTPSSFNAPALPLHLELQLLRCR
jgi:hypothetical protein